MEEEETAKCRSLLITGDLFHRSPWQSPVLHGLLLSLQVQLRCRFLFSVVCLFWVFLFVLVFYF